MDKHKTYIIKFLEKVTGIKDIQLETPPNPEMGDLAFPCFQLSKKFKKSPNDIAQDLAKKFETSKSINQVKALGPYLNFFINKEQIIKSTIEEILEKKDKFGSTNQGKKKKIILEHTSINPNASSTSSKLWYDLYWMTYFFPILRIFLLINSLRRLLRR